MPKVSIIIPTCNSAKTLGRCLDSVITQSFTDWEVLIMDAVSEDSTLAIAKGYNDSRIRVFSEPDKGIYDAMNKGIDKSRGEWLYFLGSDDYLFNSHSLEDVFKNDIEKYDVVYGDVYAPHLSSLEKGEWKKENFLSNRCHQAILYKSAFFGDKLRYNLKYKVCADSAINLKWFLSPKYSSLYISVIIAHFSDGGFSSHTIDKEYNADIPGLVLKYGHRVLPAKTKKEMAWWYMNQNPSKNVQNYILKLYVLYLRFISKINLKKKPK